MQPVEVDPQRFCVGAHSWETCSDVSGFPRLAREFTQGSLFCRVEGTTDARGAMSLRLRIDGTVALSCQRCLGALQHGVSIDHVLALARDAAELERLDAEPDRDAIPMQRKLDLIGLIEDEVLLSLPLAAMHAEGVCPA